MRLFTTTLKRQTHLQTKLDYFTTKLKQIGYSLPFTENTASKITYPGVHKKKNHDIFCASLMGDQVPAVAVVTRLKHSFIMPFPNDDSLKSNEIQL